MVSYKKEHLEALLDLMPYPIYMYDENRLHVYMNDRGEEVIGRSAGVENAREFAMGRYIGEVWPQPWTKGLAENNNTIVTQKKPISRIVQIEINNSPQLMKTYLAPILGKDNEVTAIFAMYIRIHNQLFVEEILEPYYKRLKDYEAVPFKKEEISQVQVMLDGIIEDVFEDYNFVMFFKQEGDDQQWSSGYRKNCSDEMIAEMIEKGIKELSCGVYTVDLENQSCSCFVESKIDALGIYPIVVQGKKVGVLIVGYEEADVQRYAEEVEILHVCNRIEYYTKTLLLLQRLKIEVEESEHTQKQQQLFINDVEELLCMLKQNGKFTRINKGFIEKLGYTLEEFGQMKFMDLVKCCEYNQVSDESVMLHNVEMICKDGSTKWLNWNMVHKLIDNESIWVAGGRDVSSERQEQLAYKKILRRLEMEKDKSSIYATLSHELKTPINMILASCKMLERASGISHKSIKEIETSSYKLLKQINDMIDVSKIEADVYQVNRSSYNIVEVVEDLMGTMVRYLGEKGKCFVFDTLEEEIFANVDREMLERVLMNLFNCVVGDAASPEMMIMTHREDQMLITIDYDPKEQGSMPKITPIIEALLKMQGITLNWENKDDRMRGELRFEYGNIDTPGSNVYQSVFAENDYRCKVEFAYAN